jgi:YHS domain-containing protein
MKIHILGVIAVLALSHPASAADEKPAAPAATCIVSGEKLGEMGKPYVFEYQGREIQLCCRQCYREFNKNPGEYLGKLDAAAKSQ